MTDNPSDPRRAAYHREQRKSIESALKVARWDQQGAPPRSRPNNYVETIEYLLDGLTYRNHAESARMLDGGRQVELEDY